MVRQDSQKQISYPHYPSILSYDQIPKIMEWVEITMVEKPFIGNRVFSRLFETILIGYLIELEKFRLSCFSSVSLFDVAIVIGRDRRTSRCVPSSAVKIIYGMPYVTKAESQILNTIKKHLHPGEIILTYDQTQKTIAVTFLCMEFYLDDSIKRNQIFCIMVWR